MGPSRPFQWCRWTRYNDGLAKAYEGPALNFIDKLSTAWTSNHSLLCVGLDPDLARLPPELRDAPDGIVTFCKAIIDAITSPTPKVCMDGWMEGGMDRRVCMYVCT